MCLSHLSGRNSTLDRQLVWILVMVAVPDHIFGYSIANNGWGKYCNIKFQILKVNWQYGNIKKMLVFVFKHGWFRIFLWRKDPKHKSSLKVFKPWVASLKFLALLKKLDIEEWAYEQTFSELLTWKQYICSKVDVS